MNAPKLLTGTGSLAGLPVGEVETLRFTIHHDREELGQYAAALAFDLITAAIQERGQAVVLFASAPSQAEMLRHLVESCPVDWPRVTGLHVDEYVGVAEKDPHSFRRFLVDRVLDKVPIGAFHGIRGEASDPEAECRRYAELLREHPADVALLGIGENGHLAFNDPPVADFETADALRIVELDEICRQQQVNDGAFECLGDVPRSAITVTIPAMLRAPRVIVSVPGATKARAVKATLQDSISTACPATILRRHPGAHLFLDSDSASLLPALSGA
jgi:glucosamine-6-phosphate deaminase